MDVDKETLPRWGWLLLGLFVASLVGQFLNVAVLRPIGLPETYDVITVIALMSPVLIYVGVWYDEDRQHYWEQSRAWIVSDVIFVLFGTIVGASLLLLATDGVVPEGLLHDVVGMIGGFMSGWALFWWRNPEVYRGE